MSEWSKFGVVTVGKNLALDCSSGKKLTTEFGGQPCKVVKEVERSVMEFIRLWKTGRD